MGRIKLLIDSTIIINGLIKVGVLRGKRWVNIKLVKFIHLNVIKDNQIGKPMAKETDRWLDGVNT